MNEKVIAGGSVTHTLGVIQGFLARGYTVVCASSIMIEQLQQCNLHALYTLRNPSFLSFLRWRINCLLSNIFFTIQLLRVLRRQTVNSIYQRYSPFNCVGVIFSRLKKTPLILEYNGPEVWIDRYWMTNVRRFRLTGLMRCIENINLHYAHYIVVVSYVLKDELVERGINVEKILVNPNGVDTDSFAPARLLSDRVLLRKKHTMNDTFVFGFVGTFSQWHGIEILAHIIPKIIDQQPRAHFLLIGDGPLMPYLQTALHKSAVSDNHVTFTGIIPHEEAKKYLAACDAYLSPTQPNPDGSRFFGSPTKLFEYMSMGKPIIASNLEQIADVLYPALRVEDIAKNNIIIHDEVGVVIEPDHIEGFIKAAITIMNLESDKLQRIGQNARNKAMQYYQWKDHVNKIISFIE